MENIIAKITELLPIISSVIGTFAVVATFTPNTVDNKIAQFLMDLVNFLGGNVGKASNK